VDGGRPSGKKKSTDNLNIFYTPPRPSIIHSAETQDSDACIVDLGYGTARFVVQDDDLEHVVIRRTDRRQQNERDARPYRRRWRAAIVPGTLRFKAPI
jgi:hypothetical protein